MPRKTHRRITIGVAAVIVASFVVMTPNAYASVVTAVSASPSSLTAGAAATYTVDFSTSSTGALGIGSGTITLAAPVGTQLPLTPSDYSVNGTLVTVTPTDSAANNVTITTPVAVTSSESLIVVAGVGATATNPVVAGSGSVSVSTSLDLAPVPSNPTYTIVAGTASQAVATFGEGQTAPVGTSFPNPLDATVEDSHGNPVLAAGTQVVFTAPASGASGTFFNGTTTDSATTGNNGTAVSPPFTASMVAGTYAVSGASTGLSATTLWRDKRRRNRLSGRGHVRQRTDSNCWRELSDQLQHHNRRLEQQSGAHSWNRRHIHRSN